jgi:6-phosphogluconolactonase/glucosamine-6-phosphate isomerase/deaminase
MDIIKEAHNVLAERNILSHPREGLRICPVKDVSDGLALAKAILYRIVDHKTALLLSGGTTPKPLYEQLAKEETIKPGVVGLIDERYGEVLHEKSNEKMIAQTGLLRYFSILDIPYYAVLRGLPLAETAERYDELTRSLQTVYTKSIGILGIGKDGHTSSIIPNRQDFTNPMFNKENTLNMVSYLSDTAGPYKDRVGMTFLGLSMLDVLIVLAFGQDKEPVLQQLFDPSEAGGKEEEIPARFFLRKDIAPKTILITDCQRI